MIGAVQRIGARVFEFWWGRGIADDVPALAYYLLLSLGPFALGIAAVQALLLEDVVSALQVASQINRFLPDAVHADIQQLIVNTRAQSPWLLGLAVGTMLWTSSGAIGVIERCESRILDCARHDVVTGRLRNVGLGALVGVAFVISSGSAPVIGEAAALFDLRGAIPGGLLFLLNAAGSVVMFAVIYRYAPRSRIGWRPAFLGAIPAGAAIQAVPMLIGLYFGAAAGFAAVRLFLLLAVLLLGLYTMAAVMLFGAGVAASGENRIRRYDGSLRRLPGAPERLIAHREQAEPAKQEPVPG